MGCEGSLIAEPFFFGLFKQYIGRVKSEPASCLELKFEIDWIIIMFELLLLFYRPYKNLRSGAKHLVDMEANGLVTWLLSLLMILPLVHEGHCCNRDETVGSDDSFVIKSPYFPNDYPPSQNCIYSFTAESGKLCNRSKVG